MIDDIGAVSGLSSSAGASSSNVSRDCSHLSLAVSSLRRVAVGTILRLLK